MRKDGVCRWCSPLLVSRSDAGSDKSLVNINATVGLIHNFKAIGIPSQIRDYERTIGNK